jgi:hypothetical protein
MVACSLASSAKADSCLSYLENQYLSAKSKARSCGVSGEYLSSIDSNYSSPSLPDCSADAGEVGSQLQAFEACAGVYYCASRAYKCAIDRVGEGADCDSAMNGCLSDYPVPQ